MHNRRKQLLATLKKERIFVGTEKELIETVNFERIYNILVNRKLYTKDYTAFKKAYLGKKGIVSTTKRFFNALLNKLK